MSLRRLPWWALLLAGCDPHSPAPRQTTGGDAAAGAIVFRRCAACHTITSSGSDTDGPNLYGVVGAPVAERRPRFAYTAALQAAGGVWDTKRLDTWLANPRRMVPGTAMNFVGLQDPKDRADVIAYLAANGP
ncbi:cytochrome c family protein [Sphingomonas ginsenosidivorax]|uniref:Cytochrome c family protein n=1 Tax=Sphingomonas ginsenosidivorax TaxID=862135 RepID=A0A5C6UD27_9SPHN|nr:cytochrome c family protein [Sphingomonas ginsenosidivorax]TXC70111.1 cytochrome c family protein [Sphingomonas ginsenosidivorax]